MTTATLVDAWLDPDMISHFMFGPHMRDEEIIHLINEPRVGGTFSFLVRREGQEIDHVGEYLSIARPRKLAFTWGVAGSASSRVSIEITPAAAGCELMLSHELHPASAGQKDKIKASWMKMLEALALTLT
jgi:uncharacterized protein YndB with AHSA1/START domain